MLRRAETLEGVVESCWVVVLVEGCRVAVPRGAETLEDCRGVVDLLDRRAHVQSGIRLEWHSARQPEKDGFFSKHWKPLSLQHCVSVQSTPAKEHPKYLSKAFWAALAESPETLLAESLATETLLMSGLP